MDIILLLDLDHSRYLKYTIERVELKPLNIQEYCKQYKDFPIIYQNRLYLNGSIISKQIGLHACNPILPIRDSSVDKIKDISKLRDHLFLYYEDATSKLYYLDISRNVYYICETDGIHFDINKFIVGYKTE